MAKSKRQINGHVFEWKQDKKNHLNAQIQCDFTAHKSTNLVSSDLC